MKKTIGVLVLATGAAAGGFVAKDALKVDLVPRPTAVDVEILGPSEVLAGREYLYRAEPRGSHGRPSWTLLPTSPGSLRVTEDGLTARFVSSEPGEFVLTVALAGAGGDVASDAIVIDNLAATEPQDIETVTTAELIRSALLERQPPKAEWPSAVEAFRSTADLLRNGLLPPGVNPIDTVRGVLGAEWAGFLDRLQSIADDLGRQGTITTAPSYIPLLEETALILEQGA